MAYAGNQVNTQAAMANYIQASNSVQNATLARGQALAQGIKDMVTMPLQTYGMLKELNIKQQDADSMENLRGAQSGLVQAQTDYQAKINEKLPEKIKADIDHTKAGTEQLKANTKNIEKDTDIKSLPAAINKKAANFVKTKGSDAIEEAMKDPGTISGIMTGNHQSTPTAPVQNTENPQKKGGFFDSIVEVARSVIGHQ